ncbi:MAG: hypothetical protein WA949_23165 [Phormidesmis sp.]
MPTSFQKFRDQYPEGALITDLISIYDGQYIVRASVLVKGEAIATGLAMGQSVEAAEDGARDRALAILGISKSDATDNVSASVDEPSISIPSGSPDEEPTLEDSPADLEEPEEPEEPEESEEIEEPEEIEEDLEEEDLGPPIDIVVEQPLSTSAQKASAATIALENFNTSALPVDLSDVIAQTDVELRRLGWTSAQGRDYLEKTYGKRSRQQLTDDELMSFLLYLEDQ